MQEKETKPYISERNVMIETVFFFENGNYAAFDKQGQQVPDEQGSAWFVVLQDKLNRGVISEKTRVNMAGWGQEFSVKELIERASLSRSSS
jgi:hypothetical protein